MLEMPLRAAVSSRLLRVGEMPLYLAHLHRLDKKAREQRFDYAICENGLELHCNDLLKLGSRVLGAFVDGELRGACEISKPLYRAKLAREQARELAFSVETTHHCLGIGSHLMKKALRLINPATAEMYCQISNMGMIVLAEKFGAEITPKRDHVVARIRSKKRQQQLLNQRSARGAARETQFDLVSFRDLLTINPYF